MTLPPLSDTLIALIEALDPTVAGTRVTGADLDTPLEIAFTGSGASMVCRAAPARSRFVSGVMAPVHHVTLTAWLAEDDR
jgi:hypothetical protein